MDELLSEPVTGNVKNEFEKQLTKLEEQNIVFPTLSELTKDNLNESIVIVDNKIVSLLKNLGVTFRFVYVLNSIYSNKIY